MSEFVYCEICGDKHDMLHQCECGRNVCSDCYRSCDVCRTMNCLACFKAAEEVGGGKGAGGSMLDICYACAENADDVAAAKKVLQDHSPLTLGEVWAQLREGDKPCQP